MKLLVTTDGSEASLAAIRYVIKLAGETRGLEIHLLNVQPPLPGVAAKLVDADTVRSYHQEEGEAALKKAREMLAAAGIEHEGRVAIGPIAETIAGYARDTGCDQVAMATRGLGRVGNLLLGSTTTRVLQLSNLPVTLVK